MNVHAVVILWQIANSSTQTLYHLKERILLVAVAEREGGKGVRPCPCNPYLFLLGIGFGERGLIEVVAKHLEHSLGCIVKEDEALCPKFELVRGHGGWWMFESIRGEGGTAEVARKYLGRILGCDMELTETLFELIRGHGGWWSRVGCLHLATTCLSYPNLAWESPFSDKNNICILQHERTGSRGPTPLPSQTWG